MTYPYSISPAPSPSHTGPMVAVDDPPKGKPAPTTFYQEGPSLKQSLAPHLWASPNRWQSLLATPVASKQKQQASQPQTQHPAAQQLSASFDRILRGKNNFSDDDMKQFYIDAGHCMDRPTIERVIKCTSHRMALTALTKDPQKLQPLEAQLINELMQDTLKLGVTKSTDVEKAHDRDLASIYSTHPDLKKLGIEKYPVGDPDQPTIGPSRVDPDQQKRQEIARGKKQLQKFLEVVSMLNLANAARKAIVTGSVKATQAFYQAVGEEILDSSLNQKTSKPPQQVDEFFQKCHQGQKDVQTLREDGTPVLNLPQHRIFKLDNGDTYHGKTEQGVPHGPGSFLMANGDRLSSTFHEGRLNGVTTYHNQSDQTTTTLLFDHGSPDESGRIEYPDGTTYEGGLQNFRPHGPGKFTFRNGNEFLGEFSDGTPTGTIFYTWPNGDKMAQDYDGSKPVGNGRIEYNDGRIYEGPIKNGKPHGLGKIRRDHPKSLITVGQFQDGKLVKEELTTNQEQTWFRFPYYKKGWFYEGPIKSPKTSLVPHGKGELKGPNGIKISGKFRNGKRYGKATYSDRKMTYRGTITELPLTGYGKATFKRDGRTHKGTFKNGHAEGYGEITLKNTTIKGYFKKGRSEGSGTIEYPNGDVYTGHWDEDLVRNGKGDYTYQNGDYYEGDWYNGMRHGQGRLMYHDHRVYKGDFAYGKPDGYGQFLMRDGSIYVGRFENGKPEGVGTLTYPNGHYRRYTYRAGFVIEKTELFNQQGLPQDDSSSSDWNDRSDLNLDLDHWDRRYVNHQSSTSSSGSDNPSPTPAPSAQHQDNQASTPPPSTEGVTVHEKPDTDTNQGGRIILKEIIIYEEGDPVMQVLP